jgi:hypothetical protein
VKLPVTGPARPLTGDSLTAVGKSIDVEVRPDPTTCLLAAAQLTALAEACERAQALLGSHARLGEDQLGGMSGIVYRHSSTLLAQGAERIGGRSRRLAEGLIAYAQRMTEVQRLMDDAVTVASPHLTVGAGRIWSPAVPAGPDDTLLAQAWSAWRDAVGHWRAARRLEQQTSEEWLRILGRGVRIDDGEPPTLDLPVFAPLDGHLDGHLDGPLDGRLDGTAR